MEVATTFVMGNDSFLGTIESKALTLCTRTDLGDIVKTEHHILRRHCDRSTVGRIKDVMALKHQYLSLKHCLIAQWKVNSHLVSVEVGVERSTCQRMELNSLALDKFWLECLNTKTVKCRGTVEHYGMTLHHVLKNIPNNGLAAVNNLLCTLDSLNDTTLDELANDKWLVELSCHQFGQTALTHLQFRTYYDYRTSRIVNTLTEKVLTETSCLTLQRVTE